MGHSDRDHERRCRPRGAKGRGRPPRARILADPPRRRGVSLGQRGTAYRARGTRPLQIDPENRPGSIVARRVPNTPSLGAKTTGDQFPDKYR